jgi:hypothetical protein
MKETEEEEMEEEEEDALPLIPNSTNTNVPPTSPIPTAQHPHRQKNEGRRRRHIFERKNRVYSFPSLFPLPFIFISSTQKMISKI